MGGDPQGEQAGGTSHDSCLNAVHGLCEASVPPIPPLGPEIFLNHADVLVIGAGQADVPLATRFAGRGRQTVLFERKHPGGTCVNYGCTPSKAMIASAQAAHDARRAEQLGVRVRGVEVDLDAVVDRKEALVREWRASVESSIREAGDCLRYVGEHARFVEPGVVEAGGERWTADTIVLDVGARPRVLPLPGLDGVPWLDNTRALALRECPEQLLVLGGGYIGCELGQMWRRFGAPVTVADRREHLLAREDPEVSEVIEQAFREDEIALRLGAGAERVRREGEEIVLTPKGGEELRGSHLLVAAGRTPNTDDLGCAAAGIELDDGGHIRIDDHYRTSADGVYAVGDVTGGPQFTHTAWDDGRILFGLLTGEGTRTRADRLIPWGVFTDPQVGRVGLSEREARERGIPYELAEKPFRSVARARETERAAGLLRVLVSPDTERVLGAAVVGAEAAELVHVLVALMAADAPASALVNAESIHPTFAEGVQSVLRMLERYD